MSAVLIIEIIETTLVQSKKMLNAYNINIKK